MYFSYCYKYTRDTYDFCGTVSHLGIKYKSTWKYPFQDTVINMWMYLFISIPRTDMVHNSL